MSDSAVWSSVLFSLSLMTWSSYRNLLKFKHYEDAYVTERRGRIRVEKEMKNIREVRLRTGEGGGGAFFVQPIGHVESCYKQCIGIGELMSLSVAGDPKVMSLSCCTTCRDSATRTLSSEQPITNPSDGMDLWSLSSSSSVLDSCFLP